MSSNGSGKLNTSKSSSARRTATGGSSKNGKEELHKRSGNGEQQEEGFRCVLVYTQKCDVVVSFEGPLGHMWL